MRETSLNSDPDKGLQPASEKAISIGIVVFSAVVVLLVGVLFKIAPPEIELPFNPKSVFPLLHACINGTVFLLLLFSLFSIKNGKVKSHQYANVSALVLSAIFLCSYVFYHSITESTPYGGEGIIRYFYYFILITHIVLASIILPIILFTFWRAFQGNFPKHRKIARITMPLWLYVSFTGVLVYLLLRPYY